MKRLRAIGLTVIYTLCISLPLYAQWSTPSDTPPPNGGPWQSPAEAAPPPLPDAPEQTPLGGGLLVLLAAGNGYGVYRLRRRDGTPPEEA